MSDDLEKMLRAWGHYYGEKKPREWDESGEDPSSLTRSHPISRAMEFSGGEATVSGRSARGMRKLRGTPTWGFDPILCRETRTHRIAVPDDIPPHVARVQTFALELYRIDTLRGSVLRWEYCKRGAQAEKAAALTAIGLACGLRVYRESLSFARGWIGARLLGNDDDD
jgi:hypothetical protein